jgi:hypothetical protein
MQDEIIEALDNLEQVTRQVVVPPVGSALEFFQAVYRDPNQPVRDRMRAAALAIQFESPKLAVTANVETDIGEALKRALRRSANPRQLNHTIDITPRREE